MSTTHETITLESSCINCGVDFTYTRIGDVRGNIRKYCAECRPSAANRRYQRWIERDPESRSFRNRISAESKMLYSARRRANLRGIPFSITLEHIVIPERCPVLGIPLVPGHGGPGIGPAPDSPTLDRIVPELGYVPGNVIVISWRANKIKSDASLRELEAIVEWIRSRS